MGLGWHDGASVMNPAIKRYGIVSLVFLVGLLSGTGLSHLNNKGLLTPHAEPQIVPGTDIFSVLDEEIMSLNYRTAALALTAQRSKPADRFAVQVPSHICRWSKTAAMPGIA